jgi:putative transposase
MRKAYKFKLYNDKRKQKKLRELVFIGNQIYNHCIALHKRHYRLYGGFLQKKRIQKHIAKLINRNKPEWKILGSQAIQNIAERIDFGYIKFFKKENKRPPTFRKQRKAKSFLYKGSVGYKIEGNRLTINSIKTTIGFHLSRPIEGKIKTITIKRDRLGEFYIFISCDMEGISDSRKRKAMTGKTAGFDFGLKTFLTSSDSEEFISPEFFKRELKEIKKANRNLSRKVKGSNNRRKAGMHLARVHKRVANLREQYHWGLANQLLEAYDLLCFEDLNLRGMKALWGRKVSDLGFGMFMLKLKYLAKVHGKQISLVDRFYASSKTCSSCNHVNTSLSLRERVWQCPSCGEVHERDKNAAINIHIEGASSIKRDPVSPAVKSRHGSFAA